ncbi:Ig-like domain-containing protein [Nostoc sp. GT001]|uniref:Ig-like domain-containing protein n=1 Tax=Nostoc sp. GT001 TaxID=3056647 RepID=UPI0025AAA5B5|nr:Ig-like domain-containing protein [Nostoc sp. GT001]MDM9580196.1 Ig-like domain-containing protein [Nostoc sp. GT001]
MAQQTITVPAYADIKLVELNRRIPAGTPTVTFNISQNPINNANDWTNKFPPPGTTSNPKVVRVIGGGLNVPANLSLSNYVITVDQGDINFNGNGQNLNNVVLIANNGNINLSNVQSRDLSVFASSSINMNAGARFAGYTTIANGSSGGNITFNGATTTTSTTDNLKVISAGDITYNGASDTRGLFLSVKNFIFNGSSTLYGSISAKGNIIFNGQATVIGVAELMPDITPPIISATLARDTAPFGQTNQDFITFDPTITGTVTDINPILEFRAGFNNTPSANYTNVTAQSNSDGSFSFTRSQLETIYGSTLGDGIYTLHLQAKDLYGNLSNTFDIQFTLDTITPSPSNLDLLATDDSGASNTDNITNKSTPHITGNAEIGAVVQLFNNGQTIGQATANNTGVWQIVTSPLTDGVYNLTAKANDIAGNVSNLSTALNITIDSTLPLLTLNTPVDTAPLTPGARLTGRVDGTGSAVTALSYHFDNLASVTVPFNATTGAFDQSFSLTGLANGAHTLTITATDTAGNIKTIQYAVAVVIDQDAPVISATLVRDTAPANTTNTDKITFDPSITGTVTDVNQVVSFRAGFNNPNVTNFVNVLPARQSDGSFSFSRPQLEQIYGGTLPDGQHILYLQATDSYGNTSSVFAVAFTLDTVTPAPTLKLSTASDSGFNNSDRLTNDATPTIVGIAEVGASVQLFNNGQQIGQTTVSADGTWQITTSSLTDGIHSLSAAVTDIAGNTNTSLTSLVVTVDTALPQLTLNTPLDQTPLRRGDKITGSINGTGSSVISLSYRFNNQSEIPIAYNSTEAFDQELDLTGLGNGSHVLTIVAIDAAGNLLTTQYNVTVQLDEAAPVITAALTNDTAPSGTTNSDRITFDPAIRGNIVDTSRVVEFRAGFDNTQIANFVDVLRQLNSDGTFSFDRSQLTAIYGSSIPDGVHTLHLVAEDEFGNLSQVYNFTFTLDTTTPAPNNLDLPASNDSGTSNTDNITLDPSSSITGNAEAGATVQLVNSNGGQILGQATADANGVWQITTNNLADGTYNLNAIATDIAGNLSSVSAITITIDSTAPTLALTTPVDTAPLKQGARLVGSASGTGSSISALNYSFDNQAAIPLFFNLDGSFNQQLDFRGIANGDRVLTITTTDIAGNITTQQYNVTVNLDSEAPIITANLLRDTAQGGNTNSDRITFDPTIVGTVTDTNRVVELRVGLNDTLAANYVDITAQIQPDSSFTLNRTQLETILGNTLTDGVHTLYLVAKDEFDNISPTFEYTFTLDTSTLTPSNLDLTPNSDLGVSNSDDITNVSNPTITGNAEAGATIQLFHSGQVLGSATTDSTGTWQIVTSELTDGTYNLTAVATDIAGNVSNESAPLQVIIDKVIPQLTLSTPVDTAPLVTGANLTGSINGTGSAVASLRYRFDNLEEINVDFDATGGFNQQLDLTGLSHGTHILTLIASDIAGNLTTVTYNIKINNDTIAPVIAAVLSNDTAPGGTINSDKITADPAINGTVTDISRVISLRAGFNNTLAANFVDVIAQLNTDGSFSFNRTQLEAIYGSSLPDGAHTLRLIASDEFGNTSNAFSFTFTLDTSVTQPVFNLDATSDSGIVGDKKTKFDTVTLTGLTDPGVTLSLEATNTTISADNTGKFTFTNVSLVAGVNSFTVKATDIAGNQRTYATTIYRFSAPTAIKLTANSIAENSPNGTLIGELSSIDPDTSDSHTYSLVDDAHGRFQIVGNSLKVANNTLINYENQSQHTIVVRSTDAQGLSTTQEITVNVTNINETPSFTSTPIITTIEFGSTYTYNITTIDPDAGDTRIITATGVPSWLIFTDNGDGTAALTGTSNENQLGLFNIAFTVKDAGGLGTTQNIILGSQISLTEETDFTATRSLPLVIPATPSILSFKIDKSFDISDPNAINDAFEVALVDANGNSLVHTIASGRDAFFNLTEGEDVALGAGAIYNSTDRTVSLNLTGVKPGNATLIFRLVNNDTDTTTNVSITEFVLQTAPANTQAPLQSGFGTQLSANTTTLPNFNNLTDVSQSFSADYHRTSFNADTHLLYADIEIHNIGSYSVDAPMIVAVNHISDPTVVLRNPDGFTPEGIPYYNFSNLVAGGKLDPNESTTQRSLVFYNPQGIQFNYNLVVLAQLNQAPVIQTQPNKEIIGGQFYTYDVNATDTDGDSLTYKLLTSPDGMTIDPNTGLINWNTVSSNIGNQVISLEVSDGRGGSITQDYTLSVIATPPNRPPVFVTNPVVEAYINKQYTYDSNAVDPDFDTISYSVVIGPDGLLIDPTTGKVQWTAPPALILGDTVIGQVSVAGQNQEFNFAGQAGQRIYFDPIQYTGNRGDWKFQVYSPSSRLVVDTYLAYYDNQLLTLNEDGNYKIVVDPQGATTGSYGFSVINPALLPIQPFDKVVNDRLNPGTADRVYRFNATQGQKLYFDYLSRVNGSLDWVLYDPRNVAVAFNGNFDDIEYDIQTSGEYILAVRGKGAFNEVNSFSFNIIDSLLPTSAYTLGSTVSGFIQKGEQDSFTFTGTAGQQLFYDALNSTNYFPITVYDPTGKQIDSFDSRGDRGPDTPLFLSMSGTYKVTIDGSGEATGDYKFRFLDRAAATPVNLDTPVTGNFDSTLNNLDAKSYSFVIPSVPVTASPNGRQYIYIDGTGGTAYNRYNIYNEAGVNVSNGYVYEDRELYLDAGSYWLELNGTGATNSSFNVQIITAPLTTTEMNLGDTISGAIAKKGEQDSYTFTGTAGQQLFYDTLNSTNYFPITVYDPTGKQIDSFDSRGDRGPDTPLFLSMSGTYKVTVDGSGEATGDYKFRFLDRAAATPVNLDTPVTGNFDSTLNNLDAKSYSFVIPSVPVTASPNGRQYIYIDGTGGTAYNRYNIYNEAGVNVSNGYVYEDRELYLDAGSYWLELNGTGATNSSFNVQIITAPLTTTEMNLGDTISGAIAKKGEQDSYTFTGTAGQQLFYDTLNSTNYFPITVYDPTGKQIDSFDSRGDRGSDTPLFLSMSGTYKVTIDGSGEATGDYKFRFLDRAAATPVNLDTPVTGNFDSTLNNLDAKSYSFVIPSVPVTASPNGRQYIYIDGTGGTAYNRYNIYNEAGVNVSNGYVYEDRELYLDAGSYWLELNGTGATNSSFNVQIITAPLTTTAMNLGDTISGAIAKKGEQDSFTFTGTAGRQLFFKTLNTTNPFTITVYDPTGKQIDSFGSTADRGTASTPLFISLTGIYTVKVDGSGEATGAYSFQLLDQAPVLGSLVPAPTSAIPLTIGTPVSGNITTSGQKVNYTFTGAVGQRLYLDLLNKNGSPFDQQFSLTSPTGVNYGMFDIIYGYRTFSTAITLKEAGTYTLTVSQGAYNFNLLDIDAQATNTLFETVTNGTLAPYQSVLYKFNVLNNGQQMYIDSLANPGNVYWKLLNSSNTRIIDLSAGIDQEVTLATDTYTLIFDNDENIAKNYSFNLIQTPTNATIPISVSTNTANTAPNIINGNISIKGEVDTYSFSGAAGQRLYLDVLNRIGNYGQKIYIDSPTGGNYLNYDLIYNDQRDIEPITLKETGIYKVRVDYDGELTGAYSFSLMDLDQAIPLTFDTIVNGASTTGIITDTLSTGQETRFYKFTGTAGTKLYMDALVNPGNVYWTLFNSSNQRVMDDAARNDQEITLVDDTYILAIRGYESTSKTYTFNLILPPTPAPTPINIDNNATPNSVLGNVIVKGQNDIYTFVGTAGQRLYLDILDRSTGSNNIYIDSPTGVRYLSYDIYYNESYLEQPITLKETGTYKVTMDFRGEQLGTYGFSLMDMDQAIPLTFDTIVNGASTTGIITDTLSTGQETRFYKFTGTAGTKLYMDALVNPGNVYWTLFNSSNQRVMDDAARNDQEITLADDTYTLAIRGYENAAKTYNFNLILPPTPAPTPINTGDNATPNPVSGNVIVKGQNDVYTFTGTAGQRLYLDILDRTNNYSKNIYIDSPTGIRYLSYQIYFNESNLEPITLKETGTYKVTIDFSGEQLGTYGFSLMDMDQATPLTFDAASLDTGIITDTLPSGQNTHFYKFTGTAGEKLFLDSLQDPGNVYWTLFNSSNQRIIDNAARDDREVTLATDTYVLAIRGYETAAKTYKFKLVKPTQPVVNYTVGDTINSSITRPGQNDSYKFEGKAGQRLFFDSLSDASNFFASLYAPSGKLVSDGSSELFNWDIRNNKVNNILDENGIYTLVIDPIGETIGNYNLRLLEYANAASTAASQATSIALNTDIFGRYDDPKGLESNLYKFTASAGQTIFVDVNAGTSPNGYSVFSPNGELVSGQNRILLGQSYTSRSIVMPFTGDYTIEFYGTGNYSNSSAYDPRNDYSFRLSTPDNITSNYTLGTLVNTAIAKKGEVDTYSFTGTIGQKLYFDYVVAACK